MAYATTSFDDARDAGRRHDATVNDVLLSASAVAIGHALRRRGEAPPAVKVLVPVSTREGDAAELGNKISFMAVELPLHLHDPIRVLKLVRARTRCGEGRDDAGPLDALTRSADLLPGPGAAPGHPWRGARSRVQRRGLQRSGPAGRARPARPPRDRDQPDDPAARRPRPDDRRAQLPRAHPSRVSPPTPRSCPTRSRSPATSRRPSTHCASRRPRPSRRGRPRRASAAPPCAPRAATVLLRREPVDRPVERHRVDAAAGVLAERAQVLDLLERSARRRPSACRP